MHWTPDASSASKALEAFLPRAGADYARNRNHDRGPDDRTNVSCLSPWLRHRLITEERVLAEVLRRHCLPAAQTFVQEVFWRTYFKGWLEQRPSVWLRFCIDHDELAARGAEDPALRERLTRALEARTGIDCFDAWIVELRETGYLHNHARMWFASIWIFTLQLPWQLGAAHFYHHLLDADPASNTLSWRWVAGLHTRGKHYLARPDNIATYTGGRFAPGAALVTDAGPLEEHEPVPAIVPLGLPEEAPSEGRHGLLLTMEDGHAESLPLREAPVVLAGLEAPDLTPRGGGSPSDVGVLRRDERASAFARAALHDACTRAAAHHDLGAEPAPTVDAGAAGWTEAVVDWARAASLDGIVTAWAPVGPTAAALEQLAPALARRGIALRRIRRAYDGAAWPHATKGFFRLKKRIPGILRALDLR